MSEEEQPPEKLVFGDKTDFKFSAAYEAYSRAFEVADAPVKRELNAAVQSLHDGGMEYGMFYSTINKHLQVNEQSREFRRAKIEGQRKQEYQASERKRGRNERYRN